MATQVQFRGGTTAQNNAFTGASKELTVDTDKDVVVVHDGTTAGGHPLMAEDGSNSALALGSASTPALKFTDTNTGIYSPGPDQLAISTNGTGRLFVDASGNVGIGTSSPQDALHVAVPSAVLRLEDTDTNHISTIQSTAAALVLSADANDSVASTYLGLSVDGSERLRIDSSGNVGIGTSSPSAPCHVYSSTTQANDLTPALVVETQGHAQIRMNGDGNQWSLMALDSAVAGNNFIIYDKNTANERLRIDSSGRVGIGTTGPSELLHVAGAGATALVAASSGVGKINLTRGAVAFEAYTSTSDCYVGTTSATDFQLRANNSEAARIDTSGRLLVGTSSNTAPGGFNAKLQIADTSFTGSISLRRDSNNNASQSLVFGKSRGSLNGNTIVQDGDKLGAIAFYGADGTDLNSEAAQIYCEVDGTPGANDMPGRLVFSTTADGASSPTERMTIKNDGTINFANIQTFADDAAAGSGGLVSGDVYKTSAGDLKIKA